MFTGIVDGLGRVRAVQKRGRGFRLVVHVPAAYKNLKKGSSVSVDGVCLTVVGRRAGARRRAAGTLTFDIVPETLKRTHFCSLKTGQSLNLERPLRWKGRVDGHLVQGHVDAVARIARKVSRSFQIRYPGKLAKWIVPKGSVALNGVSLTVGRAVRGAFWVHVIPHTLRRTNLGAWKPGSRVNLEADLWLKARFR